MNPVDDGDALEFHTMLDNGFVLAFVAEVTSVSQLPIIGRDIERMFGGLLKVKLDGTETDSKVKGITVFVHPTSKEVKIVRNIRGLNKGFRCSGCKVVYFRSVEEQKAAWPLHKQFCKEAQKAFK